jgi:hypothetical protein
MDGRRGGIAAVGATLLLMATVGRDPAAAQPAL